MFDYHNTVNKDVQLFFHTYTFTHVFVHVLLMNLYFKNRSLFLCCIFQKFEGKLEMIESR
jgi:hypothetical protein